MDVKVGIQRGNSIRESGEVLGGGLGSVACSGLQICIQEFGAIQFPIGRIPFSIAVIQVPGSRSFDYSGLVSELPE
jgi:hypothetical protein